MTASAFKRNLPRLTLRRASPLTALGGLALPLSLFLSWFDILAGDKEGAYTGWLAFDRTDRVLGILALIALASAFLSPSRRIAVVRLVVGLGAGAVVAREMATPPVVDPTTVLGEGAYVGLGGALAVALGGLFALEPVRTWRSSAVDKGAAAIRPLSGRTAAILGRLPGARAVRWLRGEREPATGESAPSPGLGRAIFRGVPSISPGALGLFRISLGLGLMWIMLYYDDLSGRATPVDAQRGLSWFVQSEWVKWLTSSSAALTALEAVIVISLTFFVIGLFARAAYSVAAVGFGLAAMVIIAVNGGAHDWGLPTVTVLCLLIVPWGSSGLSLDAVIRRRSGRSLPDAPSRRYGLALWIPGFTMGVGFLAAAYAKFSISGSEWITGGAVKYHFIEDARDALVDWGPRLTSVDEIAVLMSLSAVLAEGTFIVNTLSPRPIVRLAFGAIALFLLGGFLMFQGVLWQTWWLLLLAFLPWEGIYRSGQRLLGRGGRERRAASRARPLSGALRVAALILVVVLVAQQVVVSALKVEQEPFVSNFPMYSGTYESEEAFNAGNSKFLEYDYEAVSPTGRRTDVTPRIEEIAGTDTLLKAYEARTEGGLDEDEATDLEEQLRELASRYEQTYGEELAQVRVIARRSAGFDFERGTFDRRIVETNTETVETKDFEAASGGAA